MSVFFGQPPCGVWYWRTLAATARASSVAYHATGWRLMAVQRTAADRTPGHKARSARTTAGFIAGLGQLYRFELRGQHVHDHPGKQVDGTADHEEDAIAQLDLPERGVVREQEAGNPGDQHAAQRTRHAAEAGHGGD